MSYTIICDECSKLKREALRQCSRHPCTCGTVAHPTFCGAHPDMLKKHEAEAMENGKFFALLEAAKAIVIFYRLGGRDMKNKIQSLENAVKGYL